MIVAVHLLRGNFDVGAHLFRFDATQRTGLIARRSIIGSLDKDVTPVRRSGLIGRFRHMDSPTILRQIESLAASGSGGSIRKEIAGEPNMLSIYRRHMGKDHYAPQLILDAGLRHSPYRAQHVIPLLTHDVRCGCPR